MEKTKQYTRICTSCGSKQEYKSLASFNKSEKLKRVCYRCSRNTGGKSKHREIRHLYKDIRFIEENSKAVVYFLPYEYYVGITKDLYARLVHHKSIGKDIEDASILSTFDNLKDAAVLEAKYHADGYNGFAWGKKEETIRTINKNRL